MFHHLESDQKPAAVRDPARAAAARLAAPPGLRRSGSRAGRLPRAARAPRGEPAVERQDGLTAPMREAGFAEAAETAQRASLFGALSPLPRQLSRRGLTGLSTGPQAAARSCTCPPVQRTAPRKALEIHSSGAWSSAPG
jgi:hypothetical protein